MSASETNRPSIGIGDIGQFIMELASLFGIGLIGWHLAGEGALGAMLAIVLIFLTGTVWGRYRTPGFVPTGREPARPISGPIRILLEITVYAVGIVGIWWSGREQTALAVVCIMVLTLAFSYKRYIALWRTRI